MGEHAWIESDIFSDFSCKCGDCRHTCCSDWKIAVREEEYYNLIGMECSPLLHEKLESSFTRPDFPSKERFMLIEPDWLGKCRMLGSDGLCTLQKECGEKAIPTICRVYPRSYKNRDGIYMATVSASCEAAVECLLSIERFHLVSGKMSAEPQIVDPDTPGFLQRLQFCIDVMEDRNLSINDRIARITEYVSDGISKNMVTLSDIKDDNLFRVIDCLNEMVTDSSDVSAMVENAKQRYIAPDGLKKYHEDIVSLHRKFSQIDVYEENLLCNNMLYSEFPYTDNRIDPIKSCVGLSLQYSILQVLIAYYMSFHDRFEDLVDVIANVYHLVEHTPFYYNASVLLRDAGEIMI